MELLTANLKYYETQENQPEKLSEQFIDDRCILHIQRATAAAISVKSKKSPKEIDVDMLRKQLILQGAEIGQNRS